MATVRSLCVYCGSANRVAARYRNAAFAMGRAIGRAGIELVYGGGRVGLMGQVAEGCLAEQGRVVGIIPRYLSDFELANPAVSELVVVETMHARKQVMAERADGFVVLPGGFGTLDEMFETLTWRQLGLHDKPMVLVNLNGYWNPLLALCAQIVAERFARPAIPQLLTVVGTVDAVLPAFAAARRPARAARPSLF